MKELTSGQYNQLRKAIIDCILAKAPRADEDDVSDVILAICEAGYEWPIGTGAINKTIRFVLSHKWQKMYGKRYGVSSDEKVEARTVLLDDLAENGLEPQSTEAPPDLVAEVSIYLDLMTPKQRKAVVLYLGIGGCGKHSEEEVAKEMHITHQSVSSLIQRGIERCRKASK